MDNLPLLIWSIILVPGCLYWIIGGFLDYRQTRLVRPLVKLNPPDPKRWPRVSVIVPACNEAATLEQAVRSKLDSDYPDFEVVLVNDRSTDGTDEIVDRLAREDPRVKAVHVSDLPEDWLGKPHALSKGLEAATGDWFLFTDADVHFSRDIMRRTVAYCEDKCIDQLGVVPYIWTNNLLLNATLLTYVRLFSLLSVFWGMCRVKSRAYTGIGAFNLVRRAAYEKTDGFQWLKLEIMDDVALGMMIKRSGGHVSLLNGNRDVKVVWYPGIREMTVGLEKGTYSSLGNFSFRRTIFWAGMFLAVEMAPIMAILTFGSPLTQTMGVIAWTVGLLTSIRISRWCNGKLLPAFIFPLGTIIFVCMIVRGGWLGWRRDGVLWRGTYYSEDLLRNGKRFSLP